MRLVLCAALLAASFVPISSFAEPPASEARSWRGAYVGLNGGYGFGTGSFDDSATSTSTALGTNGLLSASGKNSLTGGLLGGQVGYNWQLSSPWLVGAEADWQWTSQNGSRSNCTPAGNTAFFGAGGNGFGYCLSNQQKIRDFGTARIRGGPTVHDSFRYLTGGIAWGTVQDSVSFSSTSNPVIFPPAIFGGAGPYSGSGSSTYTKLGWTIGFGMETQLHAGWSVKVEYLHIDLGSHRQTTSLSVNPAFGAGFTNGGSATVVTNTHITDDLVRLGLSYRFGG